VQNVEARLALSWEMLSKAQRHCKSEDVKSKGVVRAQNDVVIAAPWIVLTRRPCSKWIPVVNRILFIKAQEESHQQIAKVREQVKRLKLRRIHVAIDIHQEHNIRHRYKLREVLYAAPSPYENKSDQLDSIDVKEIGVVELGAESGFEGHIGPEGVTSDVHHVVHDHCHHY